MINMKSKLIAKSTTQELENFLNKFLTDDKIGELLHCKYSSCYDSKGKSEYSVLIVYKEKSKK